MAFRDQETVLRERLEAVEKDLATHREREAARARRLLPARIAGTTLALGALGLLGWGFVTYRALEADLRDRDRRVLDLDARVQEAEGRRAEAEQALVAAEIASRDRAALERARSAGLAARAWSAGPSPPPDAEDSSRFFWVTDVRGRDDVPTTPPCAVTLFIREHFAARLGHEVESQQCELEITCGAQHEIAVVPNRLFDCRRRADGWADGRDASLGIDLVMTGPRFELRDPAHGWSMTLENTRPCGPAAR